MLRQSIRFFALTSICWFFAAFAMSAAAQSSSNYPATIFETEGQFSGTWILTGDGAYNATWNNGAIATLTAQSFSMNSVVIIRSDTSNSVSAGLTAVYTGRISDAGNSIVNGSVTWTWPGVAGYPATSTWDANWAASNCTSFYDIDTTKIQVSTPPILTWNVNFWGLHHDPTDLFFDGDRGYLYISTGLRLDNIPFWQYGITVDATQAVTPKMDVTAPSNSTIKIVQNLKDWFGNSTYGTENAAAPEYNGVIYTGYSAPLFDHTYDETYYSDSPDIHVPLIDKRGEPLTTVGYEKDYKVYVGCSQGPNDFHTMATMTWQARYSGFVTMPEVFGHYIWWKAQFLPDIANAVTKTDPVALAPGQADQPIMSPSACLQTYKGFDDQVSLPQGCQLPK